MKKMTLAKALTSTGADKAKFKGISGRKSVFVVNGKIFLDEKVAKANVKSTPKKKTASKPKTSKLTSERLAKIKAKAKAGYVPVQRRIKDTFHNQTNVITFWVKKENVKKSDTKLTIEQYIAQLKK